MTINMKACLLWTAGLLGACTERLSGPLTLAPPSGTPSAGAKCLTVLVADSVEVAYTKVLQGLVRAGYQLPVLYHKGNGQAATFTTEPKPVAPGASLELQVTVDLLTPGTAPLYTGERALTDALGRSLVGGSAITFMGKFVPVDSLGQESVGHWPAQWLYYGKLREGLPMSALWDDMHRAVMECFPHARITYR
ncbi:hypothetical protein I2I05_03935 [Hymenobacter sp. BT683]|uniref:Uncharacterized protein n=1 Tax=Hymenobacter jeongseonensis TaxID=2791027 RepID=A0ABS0IDW5_9BACT|nr:hypothetical protein [Hymenobacter jeongseonensis]MBF9236538.1 hypothetical protein [Hymenobacter jeongseonensis]